MGPKILVTGSTGQIGSELVPALRQRYGSENVVAGILPGLRATDIGVGPEEHFDVTDRAALFAVLRKHKIDVVYHLAAILSAVAESKPDLAWGVNIQGLRNVLDGAAELGVSRVFWPSSIAVFGPGSPKTATPQDAPLTPRSVYGITKVTGELLCNYYFVRHGVDTRCVRYPGLVSSKTKPGGGTTDYAVEMFEAAVRTGTYTSFLAEGTTLPMMYMPDAIEAAVRITEADRGRIKSHTGYNISAMSFSPGRLAEAIRRRLPSFGCTFAPDSRQTIAESWPESLDDGPARRDWGWSPAYDLPTMTDDMIMKLAERLPASEKSRLNSLLASLRRSAVARP
jgi:nucleoside-diphosphate-sugar epimerase